MKFLGWICDLKRRHYGDIKRYSKGTVASKLIALFSIILFAGITVALEFWGFSLFEENVLTGLLVLILLVLSFLAATVDTCTIYCYLGFAMFFTGSIQNILLKAEEKRKKKQGIEEIVKEPRAHNFLDLLVALLSLVIGIGLVIFCVYYALLRLSSGN